MLDELKWDSAGLVTVVAPEEAREVVASWAEAGLAGYPDDPSDRDPIESGA